MLRKLFSARDNFFLRKMDIVLQEKVTKKYEKNITSKKEKVNIERIKNDKIVKLPWVPKLDKN